MRAFFAIIAMLFLAAGVAAEEHVTLTTEDGARIAADVYGQGERGVVLAHGGRFTKESWQKQARELEQAGFRVLAFDFRGKGQSTGPGQADPDAPLHLDVLVAVRHLRKDGAKSVAVVGGSMGGGAAADAAGKCEPGEIDRVELIGSTGGAKPEQMKGHKLYIACRDDLNFDGTPRLTQMQADFDKTPAPKELILLDGSAHAQFIFETDQGPRLMREILRFLSES